jgi:hypothetical protein
VAKREPSDDAQLKLRIKESLREKIETAARQNGVSLNAEMGARLEKSFDPENLVAEARREALAILGDAKNVSIEDLKVRLAQAGFPKIRGMSGTIWLEPGTKIEEFMQITPAVEMVIERTATRAVELALSAKGDSDEGEHNPPRA